MEKNSKRVVKDFFRGLKILGLTIPIGIGVMILLIYIFDELMGIDFGGEIVSKIIFVSILIVPFILAIIGFIVNYTPVKVINGAIFIPASDQIRTFTDLITLNPITGLYRRRTYKTDEVENVANGYTKVKRGKKREWNVVITGMKNGKSFSQRIDCSNKQVRDEVRNVLKQTITGKVNSDFAI